ncbi:MAG: sugar nucleotide-binding protein, partial [Chitinophagaceae bacterium]
SLLAKKTIKVVSDQLRTPTYVFDVCAGLVAMIQQQFVGTIHLAGKNIISPYDMAVTIATVTNLNASYIEKVTAATFVEKVRRAKKSGLKIDKAMQQLQYQPVSFEEGIRLTFATNKNP